jgi:hypothetical protein
LKRIQKAAALLAASSNIDVATDGAISNIDTIAMTDNDKDIQEDNMVGNCVCLICKIECVLLIIYTINMFNM